MNCPGCNAPIAVSSATVGASLSCPSCQAPVRLEVSVAAGGLATSFLAAIGKGQSEIGPRVNQLFEVLGVLGRGGQGAVYRVRPRSASRDYALKYIDLTSFAPTDLFNREQELASLLVHPNIVQLFTTGVDGPAEVAPASSLPVSRAGAKRQTVAEPAAPTAASAPTVSTVTVREPGAAGARAYAVYEIVEGRTLADLLDERDLTVPEAVDLAFQVLAGLAHSHARGIVHRDIKPPNVLITQDGVAKIADFGIGRLVGAKASLLPEFSIPFMGTPGYAAPEQILGQGVLPASDVYAFGVLFFKMMTGTLPHPATTLEELLRMQCGREPDDPRQSRPDLPAGLAALVSACMARDPAARPRDARAVLERFKREALTAGLSAPLELERAPIPPVPLLSADGLAAAGGRLGASALWLALPFLVYGGVAGQPERAASLPFAFGFWAVWLGTLAGLTARAGMAVAQDALAARHWGHFPDLVHPGLEKLTGAAALVIAAGAVRMAEGARLSGVAPFALACHLVAGWLFFGRTAQVWIEHALESPGEARRLAGVSTVELKGPAHVRAQVDDGPQTALPARLLVPPGAHTLSVVAGRGAPRTFRFAIQEAGGWLARFSPAGDGVVQVREPEAAGRPASGSARSVAAGVLAGLALALGGAGALAAHRIVGKTTPVAVADAPLLGPDSPRPVAAGSAAPVVDAPADPAAVAALEAARQRLAQKWFARAVAECRRSLEREPSFAGRLLLVECLAGQKRPEVWEELERARAEAGSDEKRRAKLAGVVAALGELPPR